jgi:hypothetical protein
MQISSAQVFVFVEGKTDRFFYNGLCRESLEPIGVNYQLRLAQELPGDTGGKLALLRFFSYLEKKGALVDDFKGTRTGTLFYLDKDLDDLSGKDKLSTHIVYTESYEAENYLFSKGDLIKATAAATSLDHSHIRRELGSSSQSWRRNAAENWKDWVKLCVFSVLQKISYECNYSVHSRINQCPYGPLLVADYIARLGELERRSGLTARGFRTVYNRISRSVDELYSEGDFDVVFKGKWYAFFLAEDAKTMAAGQPFDSSSLASKLLLGLLLTLDFSAPWTRHFRDPLENLIRML